MRKQFLLNLNKKKQLPKLVILNSILECVLCFQQLWARTFVTHIIHQQFSQAKTMNTGTHSKIFYSIYIQTTPAFLSNIHIIFWQMRTYREYSNSNPKCLIFPCVWLHSHLHFVRFKSNFSRYVMYRTTVKEIVPLGLDIVLYKIFHCFKWKSSVIVWASVR